MIHGTVAGYNRHRCRCKPCRAAQAARVAAIRAAQRERGFAGLTHGAIATYDAGCRCAPCRRARSRRPTPDTLPRYRTPAATLATCPVCGRDFAQFRDGKLAAHGPYDRRCPGSHSQPREEQAA